MKLIVFGALKWCGPCRQLHAVMDRYIEAHPNVKESIEYLDVDDEKNLEKARERGVSSVPTLIMLKDEDEFCPEIKRHRGALNDEQFAAFVEGL